MRVYAACLAGASAELVTVEGRFDGRERERTEIVITGLPDPVTRESRGRITCALEANGLHLPRGRLFLNLVPAARRKSGEALDLALALGAAAACGHLPQEATEHALFFGELGIDGRLHEIPGGLAAALAARAAGLRAMVAPLRTASEAAWADGLCAYGARDLHGVIRHLLGDGTALDALEPIAPAVGARAAVPPSLDDVCGQELGKLALVTAAAGGHGLLLLGPPGAGKTMLATRLPGMMAPLSADEQLAITALQSAAGKWPSRLADARPFRAPHHTASFAGMVGGGSPPAPGEISLAHGGVLFLDELGEFRRDVLEALREPLESGTITVSRARRQVTFPARFQLVAAMNPCPCGYRGHPRRPCRCTPAQVRRYQSRLSGPLLDRIELVVELEPPAPATLLGTRPAPATQPDTQPDTQPGMQSGTQSGPAPDSQRGGTAATWRRRIERARNRSLRRQGTCTNARLTREQLERWAPLDSAARTFLADCAERRTLSGRALESLWRVARTLADLDGRARLTREHLARAAGLRSESGTDD